MRVLVVNTGSSSLKLSEVADGVVTRSATVERWDGAGDLGPLEEFLAGSTGAPDAIGHRVVHGGPRYDAPVQVSEAVLEDLDGIAHLAPLHNPRAVAGIREVGRLLPNVPAAACFDTSFHATIPAAASTYALPREWNARWGLRRYGFHGLSHDSGTRRAAELLGRPREEQRVVSCHLGAGASLTAVAGGRSVDTTMGFTPLAGLVMRTRSGSLDPGLVLWLLEHGEVSLAELTDVLEHRSGLAGLSGTSGDLRDVLAGRADGDRDCALAYEVFVHRLVREVAAMAGSAGGLDLLVLTGGVGEHAPDVRTDTAAGLEFLGVRLDPAANAAADGDADISAADARVRTVVVTAREDEEIARQTIRSLAG